MVSKESLLETLTPLIEDEGFTIFRNVVTQPRQHVGLSQRTRGPLLSVVILILAVSSGSDRQTDRT